MKIKQLIEELGLFVDYEKSTCKPDDNITFYYLKNNHLTNCQFESLKYGEGGIRTHGSLHFI